MGKEDEIDKLVKMTSGLVRGRDFIRKSIEETGVEWATRRRAEFAEINADLLVIKQDVVETLNYPILGFYPPRKLKSWIPKVDPVTGDVITWRWHKPKTEIEQSGQVLINREDYLAFGGKRYEWDEGLVEVPEFFPKSWTIAQYVPRTLRTALKQL